MYAGAHTLSLTLHTHSIASGAAMLIRVPALAYIGLLLSVAHAAHYKPLQARKESNNSAGREWSCMGVLIPYTTDLLRILQHTRVSCE